MLNQPGNSYFSQPGNSLKTFMFNLPYWLTKLTNVDNNLNNIQFFCKIGQETMMLVNL